ncbi:MAG TPA: ATP-dependent DNA helicase, partial [Candidatus Paceibacterota bacterium]|nr:ATP-dependent DNA helicase [Candidatus Paceibacterota bacterium]
IEFDKRYAPSTTIPLVKNYRSSNGITKIAETLINNNEKRLEKKMESDDSQIFVKGRDVIYNQYDDIDEENEAIAKFIQHLIGKEFKDDKGGTSRGLAYSDCCILLRTWKKAEGIVEILEKNDIPYVTAGVNHLFETAEVKAALGIFEYLNNYIEEDELAHLWHSLPFKNYDFSKLDKAIEILNGRRPKKRKNEAGEYIKLSDKDFAYNLQDIYWEFLESAEIFEDAFIDDSNEKKEKKSKEKAEIIFFNLGKFSQVISDFEEINFNSSTASFHLFNFLSFITYAAQEYYPEGWINNPYKVPNAVQIMTIHQAKGLEFPAVFVPGLNRNYLPQKKKGGLSEWHFLEGSLIADHDRYIGDIEDERRLLYVAITRAQKFLLLSRAPDANNRLYQIQSPFIEELGKSRLLAQNKNEKFDYLSELESVPLDKIRSITLNFTILKDFFDCPYRFKLISMYNFSFPLNQRMGLGRSFHNSLMELHKRSKNGETIEPAQVDDIAERQMHFPYLADSDVLKPLLHKMLKDNLNGYFKEYGNSFADIVFVEQDIELKLEDEILITGRIDLIKKEKDNGQYETTIIEFKSDEETPHTRKVNEDQLKLYALGHRELTGEMANYIQTYVIGGKDPKENIRHYLTNEDLNIIQQKINNAAKKIRSQDFVKNEDKKICKDCYQNSLCHNRVRYGIKPIRK